MSPPYRLAYLVSHPIQYQAPLLRYIAAQPEIDLTVFFLSDFSVRGYRDIGFGVQVQWDIPLLEGYKYKFLPTLGSRDRLSFWQPFVYGLWRHLKTEKFDALWLHGYAHQAHLRAIAVAKNLGIKVLLRGESHLHSQSRSRVKHWMKEQLLYWFFTAIDGFLAIGTLNWEYYLRYGVPAERIFAMPYAVDNAFFQKQIEAGWSDRERLREELKLEHNRPVILFASKFQSRKRAFDLLEAYIKLSPDRVHEPKPYLLFVGDGEERARLEGRVRQLGWTSVKFLGFKNQTELPRYYDLCDIFVLPSEHEPWGLVVNEVMNAGKAVIISDHVGCGPDLVADGENGYVVPVGDVQRLAERLRQLTANPTLLRAMGQASRKRIAKWSFTQDWAGLLQALTCLVHPRHAH
jgi:glycosyltransferase involved in cell wall biosynthesis